MAKVVVDTNALIRSLDSVISNYEIIVPIIVLEELDKHKNDLGEVGFNCREAIRYIEENDIEIDIDNNLESEMVRKGWLLNNDNLIISCALALNLKLVTGDTTMFAKAKRLGVEVIKTGTDIKRDDSYTGVRELLITEFDEDQELYAKIHEDRFTNVLNLLTNEYVIINDALRGKKEIRRWNGSELVNVSGPSGKKGNKSTIVPKNDYQLCAIDLLKNKDIPIKFVCGTYGSGKTWLATKMGLYHVLNSNDYTKIMFVRNPSQAGEPIGFLPGDKPDKIEWAFKQIEDQLEGGKFELDSMRQKGQVELEVPMFLKGRSLNGGYFVIVDEAEDLDLHTLKMIGTRLGEGSAIVFAGDWRQSEKQFRRDNGLMQSIEELKGNPMVGVVVLQEDVRSDASRVFADMKN